ncbi:Mor transcription activator family protein [Cohnella sp. CFH 77786]|uniref:Mor transcription activator family protein n=1 Tax=Cohnella sp. CFH 77786 TaxID=2662265 RepID=UPI001C60919B|nr:Mor transcription activator family protein [Cohnella sp. CFH 77786]
MELTEELVSEVSCEELPHPYRKMAELIGVPATLELAKHFGGTYEYMPKFDKAIGPARDRIICKEFDGTNYKDLARKYNLSETYIRSLTRPKEAGEQLALFDD